MSSQFSDNERNPQAYLSGAQSLHGGYHVTATASGEGKLFPDFHAFPL
jgi:hypothetical protein